MTDPIVLQEYCTAVVDGIKSFLPTYVKGKESDFHIIHLVNRNKMITDAFKAVLLGVKRRPLPPTPKPQQKDASDNFRFQKEKYVPFDIWKVQAPKGKVRVEEFLLKKGNVPIITDDGDQQCVVCMEDEDDPVVLKDCGHRFCRECIVGYLKRKPACPICNQVYGDVYGDQPVNGEATVFSDLVSLPGYEKKKTWIINYQFPDGFQTVKVTSYMN